MPAVFSTMIEQYPFNRNGIKNIRDKSLHGEDWPVVYILNGKKEILFMSRC